MTTKGGCPLLESNDTLIMTYFLAIYFQRMSNVVTTTVRPRFMPFLVREKSGINRNSILRGYNKKHNLFQKMALFEVAAM